MWGGGAYGRSEVLGRGLWGNIAGTWAAKAQLVAKRGLAARSSANIDPAVMARRCGSCSARPSPKLRGCLIPGAPVLEHHEFVGDIRNRSLSRDVLPLFLRLDVELEPHVLVCFLPEPAVSGSPSGPARPLLASSAAMWETRGGANKDAMEGCSRGVVGPSAEAQACCARRRDRAGEACVTAEL